MNKEFEKIAILLTGHPRQQKWWAPVLLSLERYPGPLVLAYDDIDVDYIPQDIKSHFKKTTTTGYPGRLGLARGELACLKRGFQEVIKLDVDYCLKISFDEPVWRWRNIKILLEKLENKKLDCIDCETRVIFGRTEKLLKVMELFEIEWFIKKKGPAEAYWRGETSRLKLKRECIKEHKWWATTLGLIHLQGEYACNIGKPNSWSWTIGEIWPRKN